LVVTLGEPRLLEKRAQWRSDFMPRVCRAWWNGRLDRI